jgi:hypothetical protein
MNGRKKYPHDGMERQKEPPHLNKYTLAEKAFRQYLS